MHRSLDYSLSRRALRGLLMLGYCFVLLFGFDIIYSRFFYDDDVLARVAHPKFHHGLVPNFIGHGAWGAIEHSFYTNSLGFKDATTRDVQRVANTRRVLLMGDSFTEGIGMRFEESFAGLLYRSGQEGSRKTEFLNAGAAGYSPVMYYQKVKYLLQHGLQFDEIVVFSDISDVNEEATTYFCIDEDPRYRAYCSAEERQWIAEPSKRKLKANFIITDRLIWIIKQQVRRLRGTPAYIPPSKHDVVTNKHPGNIWTIPRLDNEQAYAPLGIEGGITRSRQNMQKLADLLAEHDIPLTIAVYPWPIHLAYEDRDSRQIAIWRDFCVRNCKEFINIFPAFFAEKDAHEDWYERLFIYGDKHFSPEGHRLMFRELAKHLL